MVTSLPLTTRPLALVLRVPADAGAVIGAPDPGVVDDGVVAVDRRLTVGAPDAGAADAEEDIVEGDGIVCVAGAASCGSDLEQDGRVCWRRRRRGDRR